MPYVPGPSVLPQYYGGKPADVITQALLQRQAFDRQRDLDAVNTGVGLTNSDAVDPNTKIGIVDRVKQAYQRVTGQGVQATPAQQAGTRTQLNSMASGQAGANVNSLNASLYGTNGNGGAPAPVTATNGAPAGSYAPEGMQPTMGLPSGGTVQTAWTPYGQRMAEAKLSHDYMLAALGIRGDQRMQQIGAQGDNQANNATIRVNGTLGAAGIRADASTTNTNARISDRDNNPSASTVYTAQHRPLTGGTSAAAPLTHQGVFVNKQLSDTQNQINGIQKLPPLTRRATSADSAAYNSSKSRLPKLQQKADSLRGVLDGIGAQMGKPTSDASGIPTDPADQYEYYRNQGMGHSDAVNAVLQSGAAT